MPIVEPLLVIRDLLQRAGLLREEPGWEPFRAGVQIRRLYQVGDSGPAAALLCYEAGARIPFHEHPGHEHILVLDGSQSDEHGFYPAGTFIINRPLSSHRVASEGGCVVLIIWERWPTFPAQDPLGETGEEAPQGLRGASQGPPQGQRGT